MKTPNTSSQITSKIVAAKVTAVFEEHLAILPTDREIDFIANQLNRDLEQEIATFVDTRLSVAGIKKLHATFMADVRKSAKKQASTPTPVAAKGTVPTGKISVVAA